MLIQANGISENMLDKNFNDIKGYFEQRNRAKQRISDYKAEMKDYQNDLERVRQEFDSLEPSSGMAKVYGKVHTLLDKVMKAFINAKKENLRRFLASLSEKTNEYFKLLNENDFRGEFVFVKRQMTPQKLGSLVLMEHILKILVVLKKLLCICHFYLPYQA